MAEQISRVADPPESGGQIVAGQRQFNTRVRRALNFLVEVVNALFRRGELVRTGVSDFSVFEGDVGRALADAIAELEAAAAELEDAVEDLWRVVRAMLQAWVAVMGFPPPPGIPEHELLAALAGTP